MFESITFETEDDKWKWGGIIGGVALGLVATGVMIGCLCRNCLVERAQKREIRKIFEEKARRIPLCVDNAVLNIGAPGVPSAPAAYV